MNKGNLARPIQIIGWLLSIAAIVFVLNLLWTQRALLLANVEPRTLLILVLAGAVAYFLADLLLGTAWSMLLGWFRARQVRLLHNVGIYGKSQILKYLPGNILSLPGRHLLSLQHGLENGPLVGAAMLETVGLLATASLISIVGVLSARADVTGFSLWLGLAVLVLALLSPVLLGYLVSHSAISSRVPFLSNVKWGTYPQLLVIWSTYFCFFLITGAILLWALAGIRGGGREVPLPVAFSIYAVSWFMGTIAPGAPAGAGVREGVMILILSKFIGEPASVTISLSMRVITVIGDLAFYALGLLILGSRSRSAE